MSQDSGKTRRDPAIADASADQSKLSIESAPELRASDPNMELLRLKQDAALKREEIQADVKKVVYGTFLLGVAVALFPVISGFIEHYFNLRIESAKQVNALALQDNQLKLDLTKLERENQLAVEAAKAATEQSDRSFFEAISDEARSARLSDRITIAEFFAFVARDGTERDRWTAFLEHLKKVQEENNTRRSELLLAISDGSKPRSEREAAARELAQIDERESGVASAVTKDLRPLPPVALELIKEFEGFYATPTNDAAGYCTVGYGHLIARQPCSAEIVKEFPVGITDDIASELLEADTVGSRRIVQDLVTRELTDYQFGALTSFVFNVGRHNFSRSRLLTLVNDRLDEEAAKQLLVWTKARGLILPNLVQRRTCEASLFLGNELVDAGGRFDRNRCVLPNVGAGPLDELSDVDR